MTTHDDAPALLDHVRSAVGAELSTIPVYLYVYWSIRPASDGGSDAAQMARTSIMTVISEEMLHMALASNLLNALGGAPCVTHSPYLPSYPCRLLRSVGDPAGSGAELDLLPLSEDAIDMMVGIELPEWDSTQRNTLGAFYEDEIVANLPETDSAYAGGRQIAPWNNPGPGGLYSVTSKASATQAITEILDQGEGLDKDHHDDGDHELAHYWRFAAVKDLIDQGSINLATDVYPVIPSPRKVVSKYSADQRAANDRFNRAYSRMLDALETALSGARPDVYPVAAGYMRQLHLLADQLRQTGPIPGTDHMPGPTFDYVAP